MKNQKRELWFSVNENISVDNIEKAFQADYKIIYISVKDLHFLDEVKMPQGVRLAVLISELEEMELLETQENFYKKTEYIITDNTDIWMPLKNTNKFRIGISFEIVDRESLDKGIELIKQPLDVFVIEFRDTTNIPLELVLAMTQDAPCKVLKKVRTLRDGAVSVLTMEIGADGLVLESNNVGEIVDLANEIRKNNTYTFDLKPAVVTDVRPVGMGTRVCIDTTSLLTQDEGMILGSTSNGGLMTCSETHFLPYMNLREFRVNAGGLHLYTWGPDEKAVYLSDLKAGDKIYVVNSKGETREVVVGRLKMESRPLLFIECEIEGVRINTFIQDDWHVRMFGSEGEICPSSEIKVGDKLLGYIDVPGRHLGVKINETISEK